MPRPTTEWIATRQALVDAALKNTFDPYTTEVGEAISATYALATNQPRVTITATLNLQKIYNEVDKAFVLVADGVVDNPAPPVDNPEQPV